MAKCWKSLKMSNRNTGFITLLSLLLCSKMSNKTGKKKKNTIIKQLMLMFCCTSSHLSSSCIIFVCFAKHQSSLVTILFIFTVWFQSTILKLESGHVYTHTYTHNFTCNSLIQRTSPVCPHFLTWARICMYYLQDERFQNNDQSWLVWSKQFPKQMPGVELKSGQRQSHHCGYWNTSQSCMFPTLMLGPEPSFEEVITLQAGHRASSRWETGWTFHQCDGS